MEQQKEDRLIRIKQVKAMVNYSESTIMRWEKAGNFPQRIPMGTTKCWSEREVQDWINKKIGSKKPNLSSSSKYG